MMMFGESGWIEILAKSLWQMNGSAKGLLIITTNLVWKITDNLPNSSNFPSCLTFLLYDIQI